MLNGYNRRLYAWLASLFLVLSVSSVWAGLAPDPWQMNMYKGVTPISHDVYQLHMTAIYVCAAIGLVVFSVMLYSLLYHRKSKGYEAASFHEHPWLEVVWSVIPFLILVGLAVPATKVLMRMDDSAQSDVTVKVVGSQWQWQYQYLDQGIHFYSRLSTPYSEIQNQTPKGEWYLLDVDKPLVLPIHKKIRFLVTSTDVVHSWWVPELGVKRDAIPGFMHEAWARIETPGVYRGQCAELCGINHGYMPIVVKAVTQKEFEAWVNQQSKAIDPTGLSSTTLLTKNALPASDLTRDELMRLGKSKYLDVCSACHRADGLGLSPMFPPLRGSSIAVGNPVSRHIDLILKGVPGTAMQAYADQLSDEDIAAITTYERNAWGNNTGDLIQPSDVHQVRQEGLQSPVIVQTKPAQTAQSGGLR